MLLGHIFENTGSNKPVGLFSPVHVIVKQTPALVFRIKQSTCTEISGVSVISEDTAVEPATLRLLSRASVQLSYAFETFAGTVLSRLYACLETLTNKSARLKMKFLMTGLITMYFHNIKLKRISHRKIRVSL